MTEPEKFRQGKMMLKCLTLRNVVLLVEIFANFYLAEVFIVLKQSQLP
jgi:hypothetical protein